MVSISVLARPHFSKTENLSRHAVIIGPEGTPFDDGTFRLVMHFSEQYPIKLPVIKFVSQMFHPNVYETGEVRLDNLQNRWTLFYEVASILIIIQRYGPTNVDTCSHTEPGSN